MILTIFAWIGTIVFAGIMGCMLAGLVRQAIKEWETALFILIMGVIIYLGIASINYLLSN